MRPRVRLMEDVMLLRCDSPSAMNSSAFARALIRQGIIVYRASERCEFFLLSLSLSLSLSLARSLARSLSRSLGFYFCQRQWIGNSETPCGFHDSFFTGFSFGGCGSLLIYSTVFYSVVCSCSRTTGACTICHGPNAPVSSRHAFYVPKKSVKASPPAAAAVASETASAVASETAAGGACVAASAMDVEPTSSPAGAVAAVSAATSTATNTATSSSSSSNPATAAVADGGGGGGASG